MTNSNQVRYADAADVASLLAGGLGRRLGHERDHESAHFHARLAESGGGTLLGYAVLVKIAFIYAGRILYWMKYGWVGSYSGCVCGNA